MAYNFNPQDYNMDSYLRRNKLGAYQDAGTPQYFDPNGQAAQGTTNIQPNNGSLQKPDQGAFSDWDKYRFVFGNGNNGGAKNGWEALAQLGRAFFANKLSGDGGAQGGGNSASEVINAFTGGQNQQAAPDFNPDNYSFLFKRQPRMYSHIPTGALYE